MQKDVLNKRNDKMRGENPAGAAGETLLLARDEQELQKGIKGWWCAGRALRSRKGGGKKEVVKDENPTPR